jgi:hypothetical protein
MMMPEEAKGTPESKRPSRPSRPEPTACVPLVSAQRGKFATLPEVKIESLVATQLQHYRAFVQELEGEEPEAGAILSAGLEMLFVADTGFARWQLEQRKTGRLPGLR